MTRRSPISRRALLRGTAAGLGAAVALPALEATLNGNGTAWADGAPLPRRFGLWYWGSGMRRKHWVPTTVGPDWTPGEELAPLLPVKGDITVVSGTRVRLTGTVHHVGKAAMLTGALYQQIGKQTTAARPTIDVDVARAWQGQTRLPSLELACVNLGPHPEGTLYPNLSHNGPSSVNPPEFSPAAVFDRLFGVTGGGGGRPFWADARASALDAIRADAADLRKRLGAADQRRLDQHLEAIRAVEKRITAEKADPGRCRPAMRPEGAGSTKSVAEIRARNRALSDLLVLALQCDLTRVFSYQLTPTANGPAYKEFGIETDFHAHTHQEPGEQPQIHRCVVFYMEELAYLLGRLREAKDAEGSLLDASAILIFSDVSEGNTHAIDEMPIVVAGKAGGKLKTGFHHRAAGELSTKVHLSLLRALGIPRAEYGADAMRVTSGITALEA